MKPSARRLLPVWFYYFLLVWWPSICWSFQRQHCKIVVKPAATFLSLRAQRDDDLNPIVSIPTTAILRLSYDGTRFTGWSAANDSAANVNEMAPPVTLSKRNRRRKNANDESLPKGFVRSVEGVVRTHLAKLYGNVNPRRIVVEGCSRTDRGVHAKGMIAQVYCLKSEILNELDRNDGSGENPAISCSVPGKRLPHPTSSYDDSYFVPLPMGGNLSRLAFTLNRMRPPDVQVTGIAPLPEVPESSSLPFHPTLSSQSKRYEYRLLVGAFADPLMARAAWYVGDTMDIDNMHEGCKILVGSHDFSAFQGVPRGQEEKKKYRMDLDDPDANRCTLLRVDIEEDPEPSAAYFLGVSPSVRSYRVIVEGDRFLYKTVRFLVGALVAVGAGKLDCDDLRRALETKSWGITGQESGRKEFQCAPAHGLVLTSVDYGSLHIDWKPLRANS